MKPRDVRVFLHDAIEACERILRFTQDRSLDDYRADDLVRSAVERQFTILGESLARIRQVDAARAERIPDLDRIVAFRNRLIHGYDTIDAATVWSIARGRVEPLLERLRELIV
jgi:uncharacterized protein with HEPN domain